MDKLTFEQALARIEEINTLLSSTDTPVDKAVELYKEASGLLARCHDVLTQAKLQIDEIQVELDNELC